MGQWEKCGKRDLRTKATTTCRGGTAAATKYSICGIAAYHSKNILPPRLRKVPEKHGCERRIEPYLYGCTSCSDIRSSNSMAPQSIQNTQPQPIPGAMPSSPTFASASSWEATRVKLQCSLPVMDYHSYPSRAGASDASTLPIHAPPGMGFAQSSTPLAYACPVMGAPSSSQHIGTQQGRTTIDEVRKDRSPLPKLVVKEGRNNVDEGDS